MQNLFLIFGNKLLGLSQWTKNKNYAFIDDCAYACIDYNLGSIFNQNSYNKNDTEHVDIFMIRPNDKKDDLQIAKNK